MIKRISNQSSYLAESTPLQMEKREDGKRKDTWAKYQADRRGLGRLYNNSQSSDVIMNIKSDLQKLRTNFSKKRSKLVSEAKNNEGQRNSRLMTGIDSRSSPRTQELFTSDLKQKVELVGGQKDPKRTPVLSKNSLRFKYLSQETRARLSKKADFLSIGAEPKQLLTPKNTSKDNRSLVIHQDGDYLSSENNQNMGISNLSSRRIYNPYNRLEKISHPMASYSQPRQFSKKMDSPSRYFNQDSKKEKFSHKIHEEDKFRGNSTSRRPGFSNNNLSHLKFPHKGKDRVDKVYHQIDDFSGMVSSLLAQGKNRGDVGRFTGSKILKKSEMLKMPQPSKSALVSGQNSKATIKMKRMPSPSQVEEEHPLKRRVDVSKNRLRKSDKLGRGYKPVPIDKRKLKANNLMKEPQKSARKKKKLLRDKGRVGSDPRRSPNLLKLKKESRKDGSTKSGDINSHLDEKAMIEKFSKTPDILLSKRSRKRSLRLKKSITSKEEIHIPHQINKSTFLRKKGKLSSPSKSLSYSDGTRREMSRSSTSSCPRSRPLVMVPQKVSKSIKSLKMIRQLESIASPNNPQNLEETPLKILSKREAIKLGKDKYQHFEKRPVTSKTFQGNQRSVMMSSPNGYSRIKRRKKESSLKLSKIERKQKIYGSGKPKDKDDAGSSIDSNTSSHFYGNEFHTYKAKESDEQDYDQEMSSNSISKNILPFSIKKMKGMKISSQFKTNSGFGGTNARFADLNKTKICRSFDDMNVSGDSSRKQANSTDSYSLKKDKKLRERTVRSIKPVQGLEPTYGDRMTQQYESSYMQASQTFEAEARSRGSKNVLGNLLKSDYTKKEFIKDKIAEKRKVLFRSLHIANHTNSQAKNSLFCTNDLIQPPSEATKTFEKKKKNHSERKKKVGVTKNYRFYPNSNVIKQSHKKSNPVIKRPENKLKKLIQSPDIQKNKKNHFSGINSHKKYKRARYLSSDQIFKGKKDRNSTGVLETSASRVLAVASVHPNQKSLTSSHLNQTKNNYLHRLSASGEEFQRDMKNSKLLRSNYINTVEESKTSMTLKNDSHDSHIIAQPLRKPEICMDSPITKPIESRVEVKTPDTDKSSSRNSSASVKKVIYSKTEDLRSKDPSPKGREHFIVELQDYDITESSQREVTIQNKITERSEIETPEKPLDSNLKKINFVQTEAKAKKIRHKGDLMGKLKFFHSNQKTSLKKKKADGSPNISPKVRSKSNSVSLSSKHSKTSSGPCVYLTSINISNKMNVTSIRQDIKVRKRYSGNLRSSTDRISRSSSFKGTSESSRSKEKVPREVQDDLNIAEQKFQPPNKSLAKNESFLLSRRPIGRARLEPKQEKNKYLSLMSQYNSGKDLSNENQAPKTIHNPDDPEANQVKNQNNSLMIHGQVNEFSSRLKETSFSQSKYFEMKAQVKSEQPNQSQDVSGGQEAPAPSNSNIITEEETNQKKTEDGLKDTINQPIDPTKDSLYLSNKPRNSEAASKKKKNHKREQVIQANQVKLRKKKRKKKIKKNKDLKGPKSLYVASVNRTEKDESCHQIPTITQDSLDIPMNAMKAKKRVSSTLPIHESDKVSKHAKKWHLKSQTIKRKSKVEQPSLELGHEKSQRMVIPNLGKLGIKKGMGTRSSLNQIFESCKTPRIDSTHASHKRKKLPGGGKRRTGSGNFSGPKIGLNKKRPKRGKKNKKVKNVPNLPQPAKNLQSRSKKIDEKNLTTESMPKNVQSTRSDKYKPPKIKIHHEDSKAQTNHNLAKIEEDKLAQTKAVETKMKNFSDRILSKEKISIMSSLKTYEESSRNKRILNTAKVSLEASIKKSHYRKLKKSGFIPAKESEQEKAPKKVVRSSRSKPSAVQAQTAQTLRQVKEELKKVRNAGKPGRTPVEGNSRMEGSIEKSLDQRKELKKRQLETQHSPIPPKEVSEVKTDKALLEKIKKKEQTIDPKKKEKSELNQKELQNKSVFSAVNPKLIQDQKEETIENNHKIGADLNSLNSPQVDHQQVEIEKTVEELQQENNPSIEKMDEAALEKIEERKIKFPPVSQNKQEELELRENQGDSNQSQDESFSQEKNQEEEVLEQEFLGLTSMELSEDYKEDRNASNLFQSRYSADVIEPSKNGKIAESIQGGGEVEPIQIQVKEPPQTDVKSVKDSSQYQEPDIELVNKKKIKGSNKHFGNSLISFSNSKLKNDQDSKKTLRGNKTVGVGGYGAEYLRRRNSGRMMSRTKSRNKTKSRKKANMDFGYQLRHSRNASKGRLQVQKLQKRKQEVIQMLEAKSKKGTFAKVKRKEKRSYSLSPEGLEDVPRRRAISKKSGVHKRDNKSNQQSKMLETSSKSLKSSNFIVSKDNREKLFSSFEPQTEKQEAEVNDKNSPVDKNSSSCEPGKLIKNKSSLTPHKSVKPPQAQKPAKSKQLRETQAGKINSTQITSVVAEGYSTQAPTTADIVENSLKPSSKSSKLNPQVNQKSGSSHPKNHSLQPMGAPGNSGTPCEYYMKDLIDAARGVKLQLTFPFYDHFLYNAKSQLFIDKSKDGITKGTHINDVAFQAKKIYLPPLKHKNMKTLILDLDETLIHCNESSNIPSDIKLPIPVDNDSMMEVGINFRPHAHQFLEEMSKEFELVIFTASHPCYANRILDILDPNNQYISYRVFRDHCLNTENGILIKDLRIFANRNLNNILLVDNALYSYALQPYNGVPILPFYDDKKDTELLKLMRFLREIKNEENFRNVIKTTFKVDLIRKFASRPDILSRKLKNVFKRKDDIY